MWGSSRWRQTLSWGGIFLGSLAVHGATVTTCDEANLLAALSDSTVNFACDGTITLSNTITITKDTVLDGTGHSVTVSGSNAVRVFQVNPGVSLTLNKLTIADGRSTNGAGIFNEGTLTLSGCVLSNNAAVGQPGLNGTNGVSGHCCEPITPPPSAYGGSGSPGESAKGGAIYNVGSLNAANGTFVQNSTRGGSGGAGGNGGNAGTAGHFSGAGGPGGAGAEGGIAVGAAIYNLGTATIEASSFLSNRVLGGQGGAGGTGGGSAWSIGGTGGQGGGGGLATGGAIYNADEGTLLLLRSTIAENPATGGLGGRGGDGRGGFPPNVSGYGGKGGSARGGALWNGGSTFLTNVTIANNQAIGGDSGFGGSGWCCHCPARSGNGGDAKGGGLANTGLVSFVNCTLWENAVSGGIAHNPTNNACAPGEFGMNGTAEASSILNSNGSVFFVNTIVASRNSSECVGPITDGGHNICSDQSAMFSGTGSLNSTDPQLSGGLVNNGGPTATIALLPSSPAIDAADNSVCPSIDQRGVPRPQKNACDIGAFEETFLSIRAIAGGKLRIEYHGVPNQLYELQVSYYLIGDWGYLDSATASSQGVVTFDVTNDPGKRFFQTIVR